MKNKLHKAGTTILLALAPAAALGVVGGVIATSINQGEGEKEVKWEDFLVQYRVFYNNYITNTKNNIRFWNEDIANGNISGVVTLPGKTYNLTNIEYDTEAENYKCTPTYLYQQEEANATYVCCISPERFISETATARAMLTVQKYIVSSEYISYDWSTPDKSMNMKCKFDKYGYLVYVDSINNEIIKKQTFEHKIPPYQK